MAMTESNSLILLCFYFYFALRRKNVGSGPTTATATSYRWKMEKLPEGQRTSIPTWYVRSGSAFVSLAAEGGEVVMASSPSTLLRDVQDRLRDKVISVFGLCYSGNAALLATFFSRLRSRLQFNRASWHHMSDGQLLLVHHDKVHY